MNWLVLMPLRIPLWVEPWLLAGLHWLRPLPLEKLIELGVQQVDKTLKFINEILIEITIAGTRPIKDILINLFWQSTRHYHDCEIS